MRRLLVLLAALLVFLAGSATAQATYVPPTLYVVNESGDLSDELVQMTLVAFQEAIDEDFGPEWNQVANLKFADTSDEVPSGEWFLLLQDRSDYPGALGYHTVTEGVPNGKVFVRTVLDYGANWEVTATHEIFEMLADPYANRAVHNGIKRIWLCEVADAVEDDRYAYWRRDPLGRPVAISDFVTEAWYQKYSQGPWDFAGHLTSWEQVLPGGYADFWWRGKWHMIDKFLRLVPVE